MRIFGFGFILLCISQYSYAQQYDAILNAHRLFHTFTPSSHSSFDEVKFYLDHRYSNYISECNQIVLQDHSNRDLFILEKLYNGDCAIYGPSKNDSLAYRSYLDAYTISKESSYILQAECLEKLISYSLLSDNYLDELSLRIDNLRVGNENQLIRVCKQFYSLRITSVARLNTDSHLTVKMRKEFDNILLLCKDLSYYHLEVKVSILYAAILDHFNHDEEAIEMYNRALLASAYMGQQFEDNVRFGSFANIGALEMDRKNYKKAILGFKQLFYNFQFKSDLDNQILVFKWVSQCFDGLQKRDSALHYLNLSYKAELDRKALDHKTAVEEIQRKYDKTQVETELAETSEQLKQRQLYLAIAIVLSFLLALLTIAIYRYQSLKKKAIQQELQTTKIKAAYDATKAKMEGEQKERQVIASVLHDQIASLLTAADMHLKVAKKKSDENGPYLDKTGDIIKDVNHQVRNLSHQLVSPALMKFGLEPALDSLIEQMSTDEGMRISLDSTLGRDRFGDTREIFLYRSCAELLNNSLKHSNGTQVNVNLHRNLNTVTLQVSDNGQTDKSDTPISNFGLGLTHIQHRAEALGGHFSFARTASGAQSTIVIDV